MKIYGKIGRLTKDVDLKMSASGTGIARFTLAINSGWDKEKNQERTEFVPFTAFGKQAEALAKYTRKGQRVFINEARYQQRKLENDGASPTFYHTFIVEKFEFIEKRESAGDVVPESDLDFGDVCNEHGDVPF